MIQGVVLSFCGCVFQSRQPIFVRLLAQLYRLSECSWMSGKQKHTVEDCIKNLLEIGKGGGEKSKGNLRMGDGTLKKMSLVRRSRVET